ncbi:MAG: hypothetical protein IJ212_05075 [Bacteroidaceae bacterium]|nr:hypothetical protein [Bacteroidaceae bacterium]
MEPGDEYGGFAGECYRGLQGILNDPSNEWYQLLEDEDLLNITREMLGKLNYDAGQDFYYHPQSLDDDFDLLGGYYSDAMMAVEEIGMESGFDCGYAFITMINSHEDTAGM